MFGAAFWNWEAIASIAPSGYAPGPLTISAFDGYPFFTCIVCQKISRVQSATVLYSIARH